MTRPPSKRDRLRELGALNPHPDRIRAPWFRSGDFFDPDDLVQVKYEMLRHVRVDGASKAEAAALFGMSRPTFYQAESAFASEGLPGLLPKQRGPKGAHKLNSVAMTFIEERLQHDGTIHARALAQGDRNLAGTVGPPTQYRTRAGTQKKTVDDSPQFRSPSSALDRYEALRADFSAQVFTPKATRQYAFMAC